MASPGDAFCPLSARLGSAEELSVLSARDALPRRWVPVAGEAEKLRRLATAFAQDLDIGPVHEGIDESDACCQAYLPDRARHGVECILVSRQPIAAAELGEIWLELAAARVQGATTGLRGAAFEEGRILVSLGYPPRTKVPHGAAEVDAIVHCLADRQRAGLVHGGINERWLNPTQDGQEVFGFGLSSLYAAWRRQQGIQIGRLRADPRFAPPGELLGGEPSAPGDCHSLAAAVTAALARRSDRPWSLPVNGPGALIGRLDLTGERWLEQLGEMMGGLKDPSAGAALAAMLRAASPSTAGVVRLAVRRVGWKRWMALGGALTVAAAIATLARREPSGAAVSPAAVATPLSCDENAIRSGLMKVVDGRCTLEPRVGKCGAGTAWNRIGRECRATTANVAPRLSGSARKVDRISDVFELLFGDSELQVSKDEDSKVRELARACRESSGVVALHPYLDEDRAALRSELEARVSELAGGSQQGKVTMESALSHKGVARIVMACSVAVAS